MKNQDVITTAELAKILGISRIAVFKKIKLGKIKAVKIGRNYVIPIKTLSIALGKTISDAQKEEIDAAVRKTVKDYGDVLRLLGQE